MSSNTPTVSVVVIAYNDAGLVGEAVRSALAQGPAVGEVIAVNDASADRTAEVLDGLAAAHPLLKVIHRTENSGGCGTPRNDGIAAATGRYVLFLDSDDVLPPGAAEALLRAAERHRAPVTVGSCVRRELPQGNDVPWMPGLHTPGAAGEVIERPADRPELVRDTLCVNKLYRKDFLDEHGIRFPDGRFVYEDFVFTARVLAAAPRIAVIEDLVYIWHVRRSAAQVSISLDRKDVGNWRSRIEAHRRAAEILGASSKELGQACAVKFLEYDLRMYLRELGKDPEYRAAWWQLTRAYLDTFEEVAVEAAAAKARWIVRVLRAAPAPPADVERLTRFAAEPPRLLPPYATGPDGTPVWSAELPEARLDGLAGLPVAELPVTVDAGPAGSGALALRVHDLYGRLAAAGPRTVQLHFLPRGGGEPVSGHPVELRPEDGGADGGGTWIAELPFKPAALALAGRRRGLRGMQAWDLRVGVECADGSSLLTSLRPLAELLRRRALPSSRYGVLLAQPYRTAAGSLALRLAPGADGAANLVRNRLHRSRTGRGAR
ncbi:glycosyltransferase family 2 protein [Streptomyces venezuelae]|uniref:Glycosyltransferase family 2 protein n=1 Tax=Streptomyces venezuelae TaxID=54571 RepID=A0A5P2D4U5_STRVZ|nr:glycosyltransferase family 2 protein [Streptomyces venezuelae]QES50192.1 glycosyltransferase family 2 protein [Streptomyces venezuelae]